MVSPMKPPKPSRNVRAYIRPMRDYSEAAQRKDLEPLNPVAIYVDNPSSEIDYRAAWIETLRPRDGAVAAVARLWVLPKPRMKNSDMRPSADFIAVMNELYACGVPIVEAASGVSNADRPAWRALMQKTARRIAVGRGHSPRKAAKYGRLGGAVSKARSVARKWLSPEMAAERKAAERIWRDPANATIEDALADLPKEIATRGLAYKVLGKRHPRVRWGRPRKQTTR